MPHPFALQCILTAVVLATVSGATNDGDWAGPLPERHPHAIECYMRMPGADDLMRFDVLEQEIMHSRCFIAV